jgi:protein SCO1/2
MRLAWLLLALACAAHAGPREAGFDPHPGAQVPAGLAFRQASLGRYFGGAPIVLVLGYGGCVNLCGTTLESVSAALRATPLEPERDYTALFVSVDPRDEKAPPLRRTGWHYLTGAAAAAELARLVGFDYAYEKESGEFAHPAGFVLLTPRGRVARYFPGVSFDPDELARAIADARGGKVQSSFDRLLLLCFHDPLEGRHTQAALLSVRVAMLAFLAVAGLLAWRKLR